MTSSSTVRGCHLLVTPSNPNPATGQPKPLTCSCSKAGLTPVHRVRDENPLRGFLECWNWSLPELPVSILVGKREKTALAFPLLPNSCCTHRTGTMSKSSSPVVHCALRSRRRLNAQAASHYVTFACHSTLVNLSSFIFKIKKIRASLQGLLCTSWRHAQKGSKQS